MKPLIKLGLKIFIFGSIFIAIALSIVELIGNDGFRLKYILLNSVILGLVMTILLILYYKYMIRQKGIAINSTKDLNVRQQRVVSSKLNKHEVLEKIQEDPYFGNFKISEIENGVQVKTGTTLSSWGEKVKILEIASDNAAHTYEIVSKPYVITTIVDFGKNLDNVNRLEKLLA